MSEAVLRYVLNEANWPAASLVLALAIVAGSFGRARSRLVSVRSQILWAMNAFYACFIGTMAFGHLLAVSIRWNQGTLQGLPVVLYPLGLALAVPAWWLFACGLRYLAAERDLGGRILALNAWLGVCLVASGVHNLPLAIPAALNVAYQLHSKRIVGWTIVTAAIALNVALLAGSLVFIASGQNFEQFSGMK